MSLKCQNSTPQKDIKYNGVQTATRAWKCTVRSEQILLPLNTSSQE